MSPVLTYRPIVFTNKFEMPAFRIIRFLVKAALFNTLNHRSDRNCEREWKKLVARTKAKLLVSFQSETSVPTAIGRHNHETLGHYLADCVSSIHCLKIVINPKQTVTSLLDNHDREPVCKG
jgi:hypothetical protein